jgi:hypothetical protein
LPKVREVSQDTLIIADGFSCESQIEQETNRTAIHLGQVLQMAFRNGAKPGGTCGCKMNDEYAVESDTGSSAGFWIGAGAVAAVAALGLWKAAYSIKRQ